MGVPTSPAANAGSDTFRTCSSRCKRLVVRSEFKVRPDESICADWTRWAEWCGSNLIAYNRSAAACLQHFNAFHIIFSAIHGKQKISRTEQTLRPSHPAARHPGASVIQRRIHSQSQKQLLATCGWTCGQTAFSYFLWYIHSENQRMFTPQL